MAKLNLLAIETSTDVCSIAWFRDGECVSIIEKSIPRAHAEKLPVFYKELADKTDLDLTSIDGIAISIGPGSFTGLRIGLSYGKGLAYSHNLPIIPVPTLLAFTYGAGQIEGTIKTLMHSHGNNLFEQDFRWNEENVIAVTSTSVTPWTDLKTGLDKYDHLLQWKCETMLADVNLDLKIEPVQPSAKWIGELATLYFSQWVVADPKQLVPDYIAPFVTRKKPVRPRPPKD